MTALDHTPAKQNRNNYTHTTTHTHTTNKQITTTPPAAYEAQCAFSPAASWLLPGRLLAGAYPFVAPPPPGGAAAGAAAAVVSSHADGEALLEEIVSRGPHVFVSLQAELPAQVSIFQEGRGRW